VEVVDVDPVFGEVVTVIVSFSIDGTGFCATAGHPDAETAGVVVAAIVVLGELSLGIVGAAELPAPDDEGIL